MQLHGLHSTNDCIQQAREVDEPLSKRPSRTVVQCVVPGDRLNIHERLVYHFQVTLANTLLVADRTGVAEAFDLQAWSGQRSKAIKV